MLASLRSRAAITIVLALVAVACRHVVAQDHATGPDGTIDGAQPLVLDHGLGTANGVVTYPGGDRVDWHVVKLPPKRGEVELELRWSPARPGLRVAMDVFDAEHSPIARSTRAGRSRQRVARLTGVKDEIFVRVFAVGRGDAGGYRLSVTYTEPPRPIDWLTEEVAPMPPLPEVPPPDCTDETFDRSLPQCRDYCPSTRPLPDWPGCQTVCPTPPDVDNPACWNSMACPSPPDRRIRACHSPPRCLRPGEIDPHLPPCRPRSPVVGRVLSVHIEDSSSIIRIGAGTDAGVAKDWRGELLRERDSPRAVPGGEVVILRVDKNVTMGRTTMTRDQVTAHPWVRLVPPR